VKLDKDSCKLDACTKYNAENQRKNRYKLDKDRTFISK